MAVMVMESKTVQLRVEDGKLYCFVSQLNKMAEEESVPDWPGLLTDLLVEIAIKLSLFEDLTAFRGVCTSWRAAVTEKKCLSVFKVPLLMLPEKDGDGDVREFYSFCKSKIVSRVPVPEARGKRCIDVGFGWILTVATSGGELNLVKPMSSSKIQLPNMTTFPDYKKYATNPEIFFMVYVLLSANPSETSDYMLMVAVNQNLGYWRNGDDHWTKLEIPGIQCFANIGYYKHKMYAIDFRMQVWMWDPYATQAPQIIFSLEKGWSRFLQLAYFVESSKGDLLLLFRNSVHQGAPEDYEMDFWIMKIDTVNKDYKEIDTLGQDAVFVGQNKAVAVVADDFPGVIKANCIYFTDNDFEHYPTDEKGAEMGIYNVEDRSIERFSVESDSVICPAFWIFPSL